jgi:hypothetical protein
MGTLVEALYDSGKVPCCDLVGIVVPETKMCGIINRKPMRRRAVPYIAMDLYAKNNRRLRVYERDGELNIISLAGALGVFTVKLLKSDIVPVIQKHTNVPAEGQIGSPDQGEMFFYILPADTLTLATVQYVFDVTVTLADGNTYTTVEGVINLLQPVM